MAVGEADGDGGAAGHFAVDHDAGGGFGLDDHAIGEETGGGGVVERALTAAAQGLPEDAAELEAGLGAVAERHDEAVVGQGIEELLVGDREGEEVTGEGELPVDFDAALETVEMAGVTEALGKLLGTGAQSRRGGVDGFVEVSFEAEGKGREEEFLAGRN